MSQLNKDVFTRVVRASESVSPFVEQTPYNGYLQTEIFNKLNCEEPVYLSGIQWDAFTFRDVRPETIINIYHRQKVRQIENLEHRIQGVLPIATDQKIFF